MTPSLPRMVGLDHGFLRGASLAASCGGGGVSFVVHAPCSFIGVRRQFVQTHFGIGIDSPNSSPLQEKQKALSLCMRVRPARNVENAVAYGLTRL